MRRPPSPALPAVVEQLLVDVVADGFTVYCCGPKTAPLTQRPMTIRPPSPRRARVRAERLATVMTTHSDDRATSATRPIGTPDPRLAAG